MSYPTALEENEVILSSVRKHWFFIVGNSIALLVAYIVPFAALIAVGELSLFQKFSFTTSPNLAPALLFFAGLWTLCIWIAFFNSWTIYFLDTWTITNMRVIVVVQRGLFRRSVASFRLDRLQEITIDTDGFLATMLGFGTIHAVTAGADDEFIMRGAPDPEGLKALILAHIPHDTRPTT
jgi:uncharacterized membrane protein YdbT with pleckstrin-like domain